MMNISDYFQSIEVCLSRYGPDNVFISFNGGKDCTVLLHLLIFVLQRDYPQWKRTIYSLYVKSENSFEEVDEFIKQMEQYYNLNVVTFTSPIKNALSAVLEKEVNMKACLMGTRRTDPYSSYLDVFQVSVLYFLLFITNKSN